MRWEGAHLSEVRDQEAKASHKATTCLTPTYVPSSAPLVASPRQWGGIRNKILHLGPRSSSYHHITLSREGSQAQRAWEQVGTCDKSSMTPGKTTSPDPHTEMSQPWAGLFPFMWYMPGSQKRSQCCLWGQFWTQRAPLYEKTKVRSVRSPCGRPQMARGQ